MALSRVLRLFTEVLTLFYFVPHTDFSLSLPLAVLIPVLV